jgi:hypothetical protein
MQAGVVSVPAFSQMVTVKLTGENFLLWTMQLFPYLRSQRLMGYIDGTSERPPTTIAQIGSDGTVQQVVNPEFSH